jgi:hypothetical protein
LIEVRLHRELYTAAAVEAAMQVYAPYAGLERHDDADHWGVRVSAPAAERERRVAGELANYVLGVTMKTRAAGDGRTTAEGSR